jgi:hypothetical protein
VNGGRVGRGRSGLGRCSGRRGGIPMIFLRYEHDEYDEYDGVLYTCK